MVPNGTRDHFLCNFFQFGCQGTQKKLMVYGFPCWYIIAYRSAFSSNRDNKNLIPNGTRNHFDGNSTQIWYQGTQKELLVCCLNPFVSVCIGLYQFVSVCISLYQFVSVCIGLYQFVYFSRGRTNIKTCIFTPNSGASSPNNQ